MTNSPTELSTNPPVRLPALAVDWLMALLGGLLVSGLFLDGWAHNHGRVDDSFFTPWHGFFYAGFALSALALLVILGLNRRRGLPWAQAIPDGYQLSLLGCLVFAGGGVGDLVWHELFGIEEDLEALLSPTHLLLGLGIGLIVTGPLRAAWRRPGRAEGWRNLGPALLALTLLVSTMTFFMMFAHPVTSRLAGRSRHFYSTDVGQAAGIFGTVLMAGLWVGPLLFLVKRWRLPVGGFALLFALNTLGMTVLDYEKGYQLGMAGAMVLAALAGEGLLQRWQSREGGLRRPRLLAFLVPALLYAAYFAALLATDGTYWSVHLWAGTIVLAGVTGWLLSFLATPPAFPDPAS